MPGFPGRSGPLGMTHEALRAPALHEQASAAAAPRGTRSGGSPGLPQELSEQSFELALYALHVRDLYTQSASVLAASLVIASILVVLYWGGIPASALLSWWIAIVWMVAARAWIARCYRAADPAPAQSLRWGQLLIAGSATSGVLWGAGGWLFFTDDPTDQLVISMVLAGMAAGATTTLTALLPAFWLYLIPSLVPLTARLALGPDRRLLGMAAMALAFGGFLALIGRTAHRSQSEGHRVRLRNERLAQRLQQAEARLRDANEHLETRVAERTVELERSQRARERTERELLHSQRMEALGQLTRGVAHDFNNLLTIVVGSVELIRIEHPSDTQIQDLTEHALAATTRAANLTRSLLAFSRTQQLRPRTLVVNDVVHRIVDELLGRALGERIRIETRLEPDLWPTRIDPVQLETALLNLALNSRDAMPDGGTLRFETSNLPGGSGAPDAVCVTVRDTGTGIPESIAHRVFEPFFTTKETGQGSGLGLSMVYGFATQSGGSVRLESSEGAGCSLSLWFPADASAARTPAPRRTAPPARASAGHGELVLIVEDEDRVRELTQRMLHTLGYTTLQASDAEAALAVLRAEPRIALLLSDVVMPGAIDGTKLAQLACALRPDLRVVLMSGYSDGARAGAAALPWPTLQKPYSADTLERALHSALAGPGAATRDGPSHEG